MTLDQQVCSLELAKRLKELGVKQVSCFKWVHKSLLPDVWVLGKRGKENVAAFTVAELGEMLPSMTISYFREIYDWHCKTHMTDYVVNEEHTEADARAKMLIYLLDNKFITL